MANFIEKEVIDVMIEMLSEHLNEEQEEIDNLFGDGTGADKQRITVNFKVNLSAKGKTIEAKSTIGYILEPAIPAKKKKNTKKRIINPAQRKLLEK